MFTPVHTSLGALLLFQGSSGLLFHNGKIFGISSLLTGCIFQPGADNLPIIAGLLSSWAPVYLLAPSLIPSYPSVVLDSLTSVAGTLGLGFLVGWGTKNGRGCTSGHMLCGLSRLSPRSLIATSIFFTTALLTASFATATSSSIIPVCPDGIPCYTATYPTTPELTFMASTTAVSFLTNYLLVPYILPRSKKSRTVFSYLAGIEFGLGLIISGMADPAKVLRFFAFLTDPSRFDPSLALIILFGIGPSLISYLIAKPGKKQEQPVTGTEAEIKKPTLADVWSLPTATVADIDWRFVAGAVAFGVGWGLSGVCPGPAALRAVMQPIWGSLWMGGYMLGSLL
ncbi:hypothetical protein Plec18167_005982 [Paecilomyces lecythidis]|uniref:YeeE/YedE family integral membrane protein n=1 Tax=Paecilomyces lecythidis TaxID=3004212 RepID=A0ABR3XEJ4_9EURO